MASTFAVAPDSLDGHSPGPRCRLLPPADDSDLASPSGHLSDTPAASLTNPSLYSPSDLGDFDVNPFFGADLVSPHSDTPCFLDFPPALDRPALLAGRRRHETAAAGRSYPLTPSHTASVHTSTPRSEPRDAASRPSPDPLMLWISPDQLETTIEPARVTMDACNLTPSHAGSPRTSDEDLAPISVAMDPPSPRVTVSVWDRADGPRTLPVQRSFDDEPSATRGDIRSAGDLISSAHGPDFTPGPPLSGGPREQDDSAAQRHGLCPADGIAGETPSINELTAEKYPGA